MQSCWGYPKVLAYKIKMIYVGMNTTALFFVIRSYCPLRIVLFKYREVSLSLFKSINNIILYFSCHSTFPAKTPNTSSTTPLCPTILHWQSETSLWTTPSAARTEQPIWLIMRSLAKGKHQFRIRDDHSCCLDDMCLLTQWLAAFLLNPLLFPEWLQFMSTMGV